MDLLSFHKSVNLFTLKNSSMNLSSDQKIIFCKFNYDSQELRASLNLNDSKRKIYIYFVNKEYDYKNFYMFVEKIDSIGGVLNNHVYCIENDVVSNDDFFKIYLNLLRQIDFITSSSMRAFHPISGELFDFSQNYINSKDVVANCEVKFLGENNRLYIGQNKKLKGLKIEFLGNNGCVKIGSDLAIGGLIRVGHNCSVSLDDRVTSTSNIFISCAENTKVNIGEDSMFATNNQIRTDDAHPIYCSKTGKRINISRDIKIGNHVWLGFNAIVLGGAVIGSGSVVAAGAIVKNKFPNNCIIGGVPAKILKTDIFWERTQTLYLNDSEGKNVENFYDLDYANVTTINESM